MREPDMDIRLDRQVALVTGGDSGIGRGIALLFAQAGAAVVVNFHQAQDKAREVVAEIGHAGGQAIEVQGDVSREADVARVFDTAVAAFGGVDIVVANSGRQKDAPIADMTLEQWQGVIDTNLTGQFLCARAAIRLFRSQGQRGVSRALGKIVCMSSVHQQIPWAGHANYAASKGGIAMLMQTLAQEVAGERIRVNGIAPGAIRTPINEAQTRGEAGQKMLELIPCGRIGEPEDVARAALFLVSDNADYIVGSTLFFDGGMALYPGFEDNG
jgi:glucose 1-dehydrogenase